MLKIVLDGNPVLRRKCEEVALPLDSSIKNKLREMREHLRLSQDEEYLESHPSVRSGVGLAAPQIGIAKRFLAVYFPDDPEKGTYVEHLLVNPRIVSTSVKKCYLEGGEGCLSVPDKKDGYVYRHHKITVAAVDGVTGEAIMVRASGFEAIVLQHEMDHLDGILYYDRIDKKDPFKKIPGAIAI